MTEHPVFLALKDVVRRTTLSRAHVYRMLDPGNDSFDPTFPRPVKLTPKRLGFVEAEISNWMAARVASRDAEAR